MTFGSLFAGIGGFDLGFERAGLRCAWQCEIDPFCRKVLAKHWPDVPRWDDVRTFARDDPDRWRVDVICGGFPCQDISNAGKRAGLAGDRSGLWWEFARVIRVLRPRYVVVENVPGLLAPTEPGQPAPIGCVLGELARLGYDAEWQSIPASAFGSTQQRFRVFIVAYPHGFGCRSWRKGRTAPLPEMRPATRAADANPDRTGLAVRVGVSGNDGEAQLAIERDGSGNDLHTDLECGKRGQGTTEGSDESGERRASSEPDRRDSPFVGSGWWGAEPAVVRMVHGVPRRLVRPAIRGLGNCVIPQVAEFVGRQLMQAIQD